MTYLESEDDGLVARSFGPWVTEKLDYLKRYIDIFETSMHKKSWRARHYVDHFAGSGKCRIGNTKAVHLGSPLLALTTTHPFTHYFFVDQDPDNITALQKRCSAPPFTAIVDCKTGDGNILVKEIVERIESVDRQYLPGKWSSLNLAFLDPDGLELQWQTVATLARLRTMDLIIHYSQGGLNRVMVKAVSKEADTVVDRFFGGREWRRIYERYRNREVSFIHRQLMDHYKEKLQGLGYQEVFRDDEVGDEPLIRNAERNVPLYRLLFASKHPLGQTFWRKITQRDVHGQARLL